MTVSRGLVDRTAAAEACKEGRLHYFKTRRSARPNEHLQKAETFGCSVSKSCVKKKLMCLGLKTKLLWLDKFSKNNLA